MKSATYSATAKVLHWLIAAAIALQYVLAELAERAATDNAALQQLALLANHKSVGISVLVLALVRLIWRAVNPPPPRNQPDWQRWASGCAHWGLYALLFAVPLSGWLMSSASAYSVSWFNLLALPDLVAASEPLKAQLQDLHHLLADLLFVLVVVHLSAALFHHFWLRDEVLNRMLDTKMAIVFVATTLVGGYGLTAITNTSTAATQEAAAPGDSGSTTIEQPIPMSSCNKGANTMRLWSVDYDTSSLGFSGEQAGAEFQGVFDRWQAQIAFDPAQLEQSCAFVSIELGSVNSQDADRDATVSEPDWFHTDAFPTAYFSASGFRISDDQFLADGQLQIKGSTYPVQFTFTIAAPATAATTLTGTARLDRLALKLGTGDWLDTDWVGQYLDVQVRVQTQRP